MVAQWINSYRVRWNRLSRTQERTFATEATANAFADALRADDKVETIMTLYESKPN
jgi:hypothetical protein